MKLSELLEYCKAKDVRIEFSYLEDQDGYGIRMRRGDRYSKKIIPQKDFDIRVDKDVLIDYKLEDMLAHILYFKEETE